MNAGSLSLVTLPPSWSMAINGDGRPFPAAARISRTSSLTWRGPSRLREKRMTPDAVPSRSQEASTGGTDFPSNPAIRNGAARTRYPFTAPTVKPAMNRSTKKL